MRRFFLGLGLFLTLAASVAPVRAATGTAVLSGVVRDSHGTPQMGALVELLSADATTVARAFTDERGRYLILSVLPGRYQLRATAAFLAPALRNNLRLTDGTQSVVNLTMTALYEAETWLPAQRRSAEEPIDDWKWTLRAASSRPVLRYDDDKAQGSGVSSSAETRLHPTSSGRLSVLAGDGLFGDGGAHQILSIDRAIEGDDVATVRANFGDPAPQGNMPVSIDLSGGFEHRSMFGGGTRLVASVQSHPELAAPGDVQGLQSLRVASAQEIAIGDAVLIDAGTLLAAERLATTNIMTEPFLRLVVRPSADMLVEYRYATGRSVQSSDDLDRVEPKLEVICDANGRPLSTRGSHQELVLGQREGKEEVSVSVYRDHLDHGTVDGSGVLDMQPGMGLNVVGDVATGTFRLATAGYTGQGVSATVAQHLTPLLTAELDGSYGTALMLPSGVVELGAVQDAMRRVTRPAASASLHGKIQRSGTSLKAQYRWQSSRVLTQVNAYNAAPQDAYLSFYVRQRIWLGRLLPEGLDAVVEATNLLQQGYRPLIAPDGHTIFLAQVPRAIQGGLSFSF